MWQKNLAMVVSIGASFHALKINPKALVIALPATACISA